MAKENAYDDQALLKSLAAGDATAFDILFYANWDLVYSAALLMTKSPQLANDIAQDTFLALWKNKAKMENVENLKGFLHTSVKFLALKMFRRMKVENTYIHRIAGKELLLPVVTEQESYINVKELQEFIEQGITQLPPQQQRAFRLSREQGLSHEQISERMGIGKKTVKDYIVRSIAFLRPYLDQYSGLILLFSLIQ